MDPQKASQLDPKLQEAYDRVMGVATNLAQPTTNTTPTDPATTIAQATPGASTSPTDSPQVQVDTTTTPIPLQPDPANMPQMPNIDPLPAQNPTDPLTTTPEPTTSTSSPAMTTVENTATVKTHAFVAKGEGKGVKISPVIWVIGGVAFLLVYTVVWIKVFNLPVPFINQ